MSIFKRNNKMLCNDKRIEKYNTRIFREKDSDPAYGDTVYSYTCTRDKDHEGDHLGPPDEYPNTSFLYCWPPKGYKEP